MASLKDSNIQGDSSSNTCVVFNKLLKLFIRLEIFISRKMQTKLVQ